MVRKLRPDLAVAATYGWLLGGKGFFYVANSFVLIADKNSGSSQIRVGQFGQFQNSDEKLMSNTPFLSGRIIRTRVNSGQNRIRTI